jgi:hypothetical protein
MIVSARSNLRTRPWARSATVLLPLLALGAMLVPGADARARGDRAPPVFAGLKSATTCIPGPSGGGTSSGYHLTWNPATDNVTPSRRIVYEIYQATTAGGEDFSKPTYTTGRSARSFDTPKLPSAGSFYFVVRARDRAGNEDANTVEQEGQNLCA